ncbi:hypothetical protein L1785_05230 [Antribacter sp. KLBMP9083]|uniref:DUF4190 domain-containing protein n=1 Tax=Antribacter soli TaxID=2910976 RepID=A0AA41U6E9_9MICO|nr:hypothetical protein [Antribacter soli]MCF4120376.1 hypothetical protein [Antribacter soli]
MTAETDTQAAEKLSEAVTENLAEPVTAVEATAETTEVVEATKALETTGAVEATEAVAIEEEDPQSNVFSIVGFLLAYIPIVGVIVNVIALRKSGKEGFDHWVAGWALGISILTTLGTLALVGLGFWLGVESAQAGFSF